MPLQQVREVSGVPIFVSVEVRKVNNMIRPIDIAWLAGLLEGEGCFFQNKSGTAPQISLAMIDKDTIKRASFIFGLGGWCRRMTPDSSDIIGTRKNKYVFTIGGNEAIQWMMTLYSLMGERRKSKIKSILDSWKSNSRSLGMAGYCLRGHERSKDNLRLNGACIKCERIYNERKRTERSNLKLIKAS
jgi:hypothetical protein